MNNKKILIKRRKRQKTVQNSTFQIETPVNQKEQAEELKKTAITRSTN